MTAALTESAIVINTIPSAKARARSPFEVSSAIAVVMTRTVSASGLDWGLLAAAGILTIVPGALVIYFVRNYIAKGFALGRV